VECNSNPNVNSDAGNVLGSQAGTDDEVVVDVGAGNVADGVCIKSGDGTFGGVTHSGVLDNGVYDNGCYKVEGVGTQEVTVTRLIDSNVCKGISHIDVLFSEEDNGNGGNGGDNGEKPEVPEVETPGSALQELEAPAEAPQAQAPAAGVDAGGGAIGSIAATIGALGASIASLGYGLLRLRNLGA
jgi:hypothetical protein